MLEGEGAHWGLALMQGGGGGDGDRSENCL